jgi:large subunit ribosomal protein L25
MEAVKLDAKIRDLSKHTNLIRRENLIPAEYYGGGKENVHLTLDYQTFRKAYIKAGENTVIDLNVEGGKSLKVLVQDVQYNPVTDKFTHIDFINVDMDKDVTAMIPLKFINEAPAVKNLGGIVTTQRHEIEVRCLPSDLIKEVEVDISVLVDFSSYVYVKDLNFPESITVLDDPEQIVVTVVPPKVEKEEEAPKPVEGEEGAAAVPGAEGAAPAGEAKSGEKAEGGDAGKPAPQQGGKK